MALGDLYGVLGELETQRGEVLEVRAAIRAEMAAMEAAFATSGNRPSIEPLACAAAQSAQALRKLDFEIQSVRAAIVQARLERGDKADIPPDTVSAWYPYLGPGELTKGGKKA